VVDRTVTVDWDDYEIYHPGVLGPLRMLPRADARRAFDKCMEEKPARVGMLRRLLKANGVDLASSDAGIQDLNDWFVANVEPDPAQPGRLLADWYSVVNDVALFLGDVMIERCPTLRWEFFTGGKKDVAYQRHVIMGFTQVSNPKYNIDIDRRVAAYGHRVIASRGSVAHHDAVTVRGVEIDVDAVVGTPTDQEVEEDAFWQWVRAAEAKA
jgi:hypothetical protein